MVKKTIKDVCEIFWDLEKKYDLLDLSIQDVKVWLVVRFKLYRDLTELVGWQEQAHSKNTNLDVLKKVPKYVVNSFVRNPFARKKTDAIILSHPRPKIVDEENIDIYTKYFIEELKKNNIEILELEPDYLGEHPKSLKEHVVYTDFISLVTKVFKRFIYLKFSKEEKELIANINSELSKGFCIDVDITHLFIDQIRDFKAKVYLYNKLFLKLCPKILYVCPSYGNSAVIYAAKQLRIQVIELQHGTINKYHLGYSFPTRVDKLEYFPDKFFVWNEYWKEHSSLPLSKENVVIRKFDFLEKNKLKHLKCKKKLQIVILSQGNIGNQLAKFVLNNIQLFKGLKLIYKIHPGEFDRYKEYVYLNKLVECYPDVEVLEDADLHLLLAESKYQLGVNSTALYEGIEFNCSTILVDMPGVEYMEDLIKSKGLIKHGKFFMTMDAKIEFVKGVNMT
ncbi:MAG: hypothetical protein COB62_03690 [Piscirickettsiaceae bacterium]|nr:MAG: hypothetical protein COB62_03690 [Piscirickettsiaceae bacterium]